MLKRYAFRWLGGGWNEVFASSPSDAMERAMTLGRPAGRRTEQLWPDESTLVRVHDGEQNPYYQFID